MAEISATTFREHTMPRARPDTRTAGRQETAVQAAQKPKSLPLLVCRAAPRTLLARVHAGQTAVHRNFLFSIGRAVGAQKVVKPDLGLAVA